MSKTATIIELNGRRYNAATGALLESASRSVDGMLSAPVRAEQSELSPAHRGVDRAGQHPAKHHPVQRSQTLMRSSVRRPGDSFKRHAKTTSHTGAVVKAAHYDVVPKHSAHVVDPDRLQRAGQSNRSEYVRRFADTPIVLSHAEESYMRQTEPATTAPAQALAAPSRAVRHDASNDIFERALAAANSHKQPYAPTKHKSRRGHHLRVITSVMASLVAVVLIVGFVAYQNSATIQLRLASSRSGIAATMPIWQPSGFKLGTFAYKPGSVSLTYDNAQSGEQYSIDQRASTWDSVALLNDYVYPNNETYNTITADGTTIYTYGDNNATWVDHGIWYRLTTDGTLSTSQIVNIATSMRS